MSRVTADGVSGARGATAERLVPYAAAALTAAVFLSVPLVDVASPRPAEALRVRSLATVPPEPPRPDRARRAAPSRPEPLPAWRPETAAARPVTLDRRVSAAGLRALAFGDVATGAGAPLEGLAVADGGVFDLALLDEAPQPVMRLEPVYPPAARLRRQEGHVVMEFVVNEDGTTADITVLSAEPRGVFERAAAAAVKAWRFRPGRREGRAVATRVRQRVSFRLE